MKSPTPPARAREIRNSLVSSYRAIKFKQATPDDLRLWNRVQALSEDHSKAVQAWVRAVYYKRTQKMECRGRVQGLVREAVNMLADYKPAVENSSDQS